MKKNIHGNRFHAVAADAAVDWDHPLNRNLAAWWATPPGIAATGSRAVDLCGRYPATSANTSSTYPGFAPGRGGFGAMSFGNNSGTSNYFNLTAPSLASIAFTVEVAWRCTDNANSNTLYQQGSTQNPDQFLHLRVDSPTSIRFGMWFDDLDVTIPSGQALLENHTVFSLAADKTQKVFNNGVLLGSQTAGGLFTGDTVACIGMYTGGGNINGFSGLIHSIRVYAGRAVATAGEAALLYSLWQQNYQTPDSPLRWFSTRTHLIPAAGGDVTVALTGTAATASAGTLVPSTTVALAGSAATATAGTLAPSVTVALAGSGATASAGTLTPSRTVALAGQSSTASAGTLAPSTTTVLSGSGATTATGTVAPVTSLAVAGSVATSAAGALTPASTVALAGAAGTAATGTLAPSATVPLVGDLATVAGGTVATATTIGLVGASAVGAAGTVAVGNDVTVALTGTVASSAVGSLGAAIDLALAGSTASASAGTVVPSGGDSTAGAFVRLRAFGQPTGTAPASGQTRVTGTGGGTGTITNRPHGGDGGA